MHYLETVIRIGTWRFPSSFLSSAGRMIRLSSFMRIGDRTLISIAASVLIVMPRVFSPVETTPRF